jgi:glycosyltransferase involved in cell wall biosynthesis
MEVIIVHYHLNPGGVSSIIEAQIQGIKAASADTDLKILSSNGNELTALNDARTAWNEALNYMNPGQAGHIYVDVVSAIISFIRQHISDHSILHFHNPNLGKNPALTMAVYKLAAEGLVVINHCHDFPEDRPANLAWLERVVPGLSALPLQQVMYPDFPWYHFIVLNSCDRDRILHQGVPDSRIHLLPNPVLISEHILTADKQSLKRKICRILGFNGEKKICTYPVRAIERKNPGEFILFAALFADVAEFAITQPPRNPMELKQYNRWKAFCRENGIMLKFEAGVAVNHEELIIISDFCITTSIREGFGMVFLEPWMAGTPVVGRELTCIIGDLKKKGIEFPRLYSTILVETTSGRHDFKDLSQNDQEKLIQAVTNDPELKLNLFRNNPFLSKLLDDISPEIIRRNQQVIKEKFSIEEYGKKLLAIYKEVSR